MVKLLSCGHALSLDNLRCPMGVQWVSNACPMGVQCTSNGQEATSNECPPKPSTHEASEASPRYGLKPAASICWHTSSLGASAGYPAASSRASLRSHRRQTTFTMSDWGSILDKHWTRIGHPLDTHWTSIGHPLDTHWTPRKHSKIAKPLLRTFLLSKPLIVQPCAVTR